jgi:hypothetical protein
MISAVFEPKRRFRVNEYCSLMCNKEVVMSTKVQIPIGLRVSSHRKASLARQQEQIKSLKAEILAPPTRILPMLEQDSPDQSDTHTNFVATGPTPQGIGFLAQANTNAGLRKGVVGIGSSQFQDQIKTTIGVLGYTATLDGGPGDGTGVVGVAASENGIGVQGRNLNDGTGVQGVSDTGVGVDGVSRATGVFGFGGWVGVQGVSDVAGVVGGDLEGRLLNGDISVGVVGTAVNDVGPDGSPFSYGGWFVAPNGTAPLHLEPSSAAAPTSAALRGDLFVDNSGKLWFCTDSGDPATWRQIQLV